MKAWSTVKWPRQAKHREKFATPHPRRPRKQPSYRARLRVSLGLRQNPVEEAQRAAESEVDSTRKAEHVGGEKSAATTATAGAAATETTKADTAAAASLGGLEGLEAKRTEATAAQAAEVAGAATAKAAAVATAMRPGTGKLEMVLAPPYDAPVIIIQRLVRGRLMRETYKMLKVLVSFQVFFSRWVAVVRLSIPLQGGTSQRLC